MLFIPPTLGHGGSLETNLTVTARQGTTVTASATPHTKGSWTNLVDPTSRPSFGIWVRIGSVSATNTNTATLVDIGYGPTGGGNEQVILPDLDAGNAGNAGNGQTAGKLWYFPIYIPTGVRVSARSQGVVASQTAIVTIWLEEDPLYANPVGGVLAYGVDSANSRGTSVTPGSGAFGSWTQIVASTSRPHRFWAVGYDTLGDASIAQGDLLVELGVGPDSSNVSRLYQGLLSQASVEAITGAFPPLCYGPVASGKTIFARIASMEVEARGIIAYGVD